MKIEEDILKDIDNMNFKQVNKIIGEFKENYFHLTPRSMEYIIETLNSDSRKNVRTLGRNFKNFILKEKNEISRVEKMYDFDRSFGNCIFTAGVDEVGRGPLAGPIAAAAVVLDLKCKNQRELILGIKDSKKMTPKSRDKISKLIKEMAISYNISFINNEEIDKRGISWCNNEVLKRAVQGVKVPVNLVLSDGYAVKNMGIDNEYIIKGDSKSASIAAASIIAKVYRDNLMKEYAKKYPQYNFSSNSGYGTKEHIDAIKKYGVCKLHRLSFLRNII